jgi:hypothetical protein
MINLDVIIAPGSILPFLCPVNAYLFTAIATLSQVRLVRGRYGDSESLQTWDSCSSSIVRAESADSAQKRFEEWLSQPQEGDHPRDVQIKCITAAQFIDQLFTETGSVPLIWSDILEKLQAQTESTPADDFEQGYWVDVDTVVPPGQMSTSIELLQRDLPPDISNGLNWSAQRQFLYLLTSLTPPQPPMNTPAMESDEEASADAAIAEKELEQLLATYPQGAQKDAVALIQARNSIVAAMLWRRFAAGTRLVSNKIRLDPVCCMLGNEQ